MSMSRDDIYKKVKGVLVEALSVDEEEVTPGSALSKDLGAESIDYLDINFRLEKAFTVDPAKPFRIPRGELFPENLPQMMNDESLVKDGKVTPAGIVELKKRLPFASFDVVEKDPTVENAMSLITVDAVVNYVQSKIATT
jgi:acyl carrier protein